LQCWHWSFRLLWLENGSVTLKLVMLLWSSDNKCQTDFATTLCMHHSLVRMDWYEPCYMLTLLAALWTVICDQHVSMGLISYCEWLVFRSYMLLDGHFIVLTWNLVVLNLNIIWMFLYNVT
jgi:hypothetical protein